MKEVKKGHLHPITQIMREFMAIFNDMGFTVATGPELETEFYNFDALNIPSDHPARDMQDTFWIKEKMGEVGEVAKGEKSERHVMRTHTSSVQIRFMQNHKPPFKMVSPGRVFRNEATDATHETQFYQVEGLYVDKNVSMAHLKGTLKELFEKLYGDSIEIRFRPSFFAFVEPGVEVDVKRGDKWLEVCGAGLVHPEVLRAGGINPEEWQGFAFGFGFDRMVMLKYELDDIRMLYNGDERLIEQF
ncbi:MAG: phenylalanine--tRNA ligase subunit alpha [bacterium]|nr:phenylalanine--tRNA ligase subunit alpha [bacterium]